MKKKTKKQIQTQKNLKDQNKDNSVVATQDTITGHSEVITLCSVFLSFACRRAKGDRRNSNAAC